MAQLGMVGGPCLSIMWEKSLNFMKFNIPLWRDKKMCVLIDLNNSYNILLSYCPTNEDIREIQNIIPTSTQEFKLGNNQQARV